MTRGPAIHVLRTATKQRLDASRYNRLAMDESVQGKTYSLVFDGRVVPGRNAAEVESDFSDRFGASTAEKVFSGGIVTLNRNQGRDEARKKQAIYEKLGILVQIVPTATRDAHLTIAEAPPEIEQSAPPVASPATPSNNPKAASFGELPDRAVASAKEQPNDVYTKAELAEAFKDAVEMPPASRDYLHKLVPVTLLMLFLPIIYVAITLASGAATYSLAVNGFDWFIDNPGYLTLIGYAGSLLGMSLLTLFLLRPFVAGGNKGPKPVRVDPQREPILYELVDRVTDAVGAPMPHEILLDSDANASARLTHGAFSKELTLTIGMPLMHGLDLQSLTGVLAHEFGHFTQQVGMSASTLVHEINYWFYRQIHERDNWDRFVDKWLDSGFAIFQMAAFLAQVGSFIVRLLLQLLATLASAVSSSLSRQMEYDADRYEIGLVGSAAFESTSINMRRLVAGHQDAVQDVLLALDGDSKVDNLPKLATMKAERLTEEQLKKIRADADLVDANTFDTHPPDRDRIRRAQEADLPARFVHTGPASRLLREPERLGKLVTLQWYRSIGIDLSPKDMTPIENFSSETDLLDSAESALNGYFGDTVPPDILPLLDKKTLAAANEKQLTDALRKLTSVAREKELGMQEALDQLQDSLEYQGIYRHALLWRKANVPIDLNGYSRPIATDDPEKIAGKIRKYQATEAEARQALHPILDSRGKRLSVALELAIRRGTAEKQSVEALRNAYAAIGSTVSTVTQLQHSGERLEFLLQILEVFPEDAKRARNLKKAVAENLMLHRQMHVALAGTDDPFAQGGSLADLLPSIPDADADPLAALDVSARLMRIIDRTNFKVLGAMAQIALAQQTSNQGPPQPAPTH